MPPVFHFSHRRERLENLFREVGTLLIALTPLDAVLWGDRPERGRLVLIFVIAGILLFELAVFSEHRRTHVG